MINKLPQLKIIKDEVYENKHIPYSHHVTESVIKTKDGQYVMTFKVNGLSFETKSDEELNIAAEIRNNLYVQFEGDPIIFTTHVQRKKIQVNHKSKFKGGFLKRFDEKTNAKFKSQKYFVNELYFSVTHKAAGNFHKQTEKISSIFGKSENQNEAEKDILIKMNDWATSIQGAFKEYGIKLLKTYEKNKITWSEPMRFYGSIINQKNYDYKLPPGPICDYLPVVRKFFGFRRMAFENKDKDILGVVLSIKNYSQHTLAGMFDVVNALHSEATLTQSWEPISKTAAINKIKKTARRMEQGDDAVTLKRDLEAEGGIIDQLSSNQVAMGTNHFSLFIFDDNEESLEAAIGEAEANLAQLGITPVLDNINLEPAFWAQLPGNSSYIARKGDISSFNFADFASLHNMPIGERSCKWGEHITTLTTTMKTPYFFNLHDGDVGIVSIVGPSGSGKTVGMLGFIAQAMKHNPRVFFFDKDYGAKIFIKAIDGEYSPIHIGKRTGWNPLQLDDTPQNREFLKHLIKMIMRDGDDFSATEKSNISELVDEYIFNEAKEDRILRNFLPIVTDTLPKRLDNFKRWITDGYGQTGENAWVFDNDEHHSAINSRVLAFDMTEFIEKDEIRSPIMSFLFHQIVNGLDGNPAIIAIDEAWKALAAPEFEVMIQDWARTIRKKNGVLITATQNASDAHKSQALVDQTQTGIFFPNKKAKQADYEAWGLTEREIHLLRTVPTKRGFFVLKRGDESLIAKLDLTGCENEIAVLSATTGTVKLMDELISQYGDKAKDWLPHFYNEWSNYV